MNIGGAQIDLSGLIGVLVSIVTALLGWLAVKVKGAAQASTDKSKTEQAGLKVAALVTAMAGKAWDTLAPKLQAALADGTISPEERSAIEAQVKLLVADFTSEDDLKALADALGLPLPGLIAKIASMLIGIFTSAHDPAINTVSAKAYPVAPMEKPISMVDLAPNP